MVKTSPFHGEIGGFNSPRGHFCNNNFKIFKKGSVHLKLEVIIRNNGNRTFETKSFKTKDKAIEWCKHNAPKLETINGQTTYGKLLTPYEYEAIFRGEDIL